jgi:hypothetical protein
MNTPEAILRNPLKGFIEGPPASPILPLSQGYRQDSARIACGVFLLQGRNWARWLALAWIAFHLAFSFFDSLQKAAIHGLFMVLIAYFLFRPDARTYFQRREEMRT